MIGNGPVFSSEDLQANTEKRNKLVRLIQSGEAVLMAGAGCSGSLFPVWLSFMTELKQQALEIDPTFNANDSDYLDFADKVKECLGDDRYYSAIHETFKARDPTHKRFHESLCRMPFRAFTTTNYDKVLEYALTTITLTPDNSLYFEGITKNIIHEFLRSLNHNSGLPKRVMHLHGVHDVKASIVLGSREYLSKYGFALNEQATTLYDEIQSGAITKEDFERLLLQHGYSWPLRRKLLWSLLATRRLFFVGFSMTDPYFTKMLDFVKDDVGTYNGESHFLLLRVTAGNFEDNRGFAKMLKREYGIETIFFEEKEDEYDGLGNFIFELEAEVMATVNKAPNDQIIGSNADDEGDEDVTQQLFQLSRKQGQHEGK